MCRIPLTSLSKYKLQLTKKIMTCSVCKQSGHNKSKCPENKEPKKKRTRVAAVAEGTPQPHLSLVLTTR